MFSKTKEITVTTKDFINRDTLWHTEFLDINGMPWLIQVLPDHDECNPRKEYAHSWTWVTTRGAGYSDVKNEEPKDYHDNNGKLDKVFLKENIVVPLSLYRHSGDSISVGSTHPMRCPWDSGCMGFAYINREQAKKDHGWKVITEKNRKQLISYLHSEVEEMNAWLTGNVYGIKVTNLQTEYEDSCWGFICSDKEDLEQRCREMLNSWVELERIPEIIRRLDIWS